MSILSGKDGTLRLDGDLVLPITNWKLQLLCQGKEYVANDTGGATRRLPGPEDSQGSFLCYATDDGQCPVRRGQRATAQLHADAGGANYYEVPIYVEQIELECDISRGREVVFGVHFRGDGPAASHGALASPDDNGV